MKLIFVIVLAVALSVEASYTLPKLVVPSVTYGVPEEPKPVVPAVVYGVPEEHKSETIPVKTEYSYTIPAVSTHHEEVITAPVSPVVAVHPEPSEIHVPSGVTTLVDGYTLPQAPVAYTPGYISSVPVYNPQIISAPLAYSSVYSYGYGYSTPHVSYPQVLYSGSPLVSTVPSSQVTITGPSQISTVITGAHEVPEVSHEEEVVSKYQYEIPHVVVPEVVKPVVPHTTYGLPRVVVSEPVVPHTTYGVPL